MPVKLRSFPTKCKYCGKPILYWESTQGAKVFFNLPIYGRPIRHHCQARHSRKKKPIVKETALDHLRKKVDRISFQCPVCGKIQTTEQDLDQHFRQLRKYDDAHAEFYEMFDFFSKDKIEGRSEERTESDPQSSPLKPFQTDHSLEVNEDRFILKTKSSKLKSKFKNLSKTKKR
ncbi:MAG: hypothetical protein ACTSYI_08255 [Promethearchaeota archaeon]